MPAPARPALRTRIGAFATLSLLAAALCYGAYSVYTAARDAFVVPTILSPTSDAVVATKLRLGGLRVERVRAVGELEAVEAALAGAEQAVARLQELERTAGEARHWTTRVTSQRARQTAAELMALSDQKQVLANMLSSKQQLVERARRDFDAGLISRGELARHE